MDDDTRYKLKLINDKIIEMKNLPIGFFTNPEALQIVSDTLADLEIERKLLLEGYTEIKNARVQNST